MNESTQICPRCGTSYPPAVAGGLCPHCLLSQLMAARPERGAGEEPGDVLGPFELVEPLGEGGMGTVWRARQLYPVEREVALKIIRRGMNTREVAARFELERQTLVRMEHPNIARVFEAGSTPEGRAYFAMELVEGESITVFCRGRALSLKARLDLFLQMCAAVEHAHRKGVIHRDLKPSNVLVSVGAEGPRVKVIDFGVAKLFERSDDGMTFATQIGQVVGTPGYMSPEQAGATIDLDTRSDVYSLGALLYELLTGSSPVSAETVRSLAVGEIMRIIRETDPPRPSTRLGQAPAGSGRSSEAVSAPIPRDLDRIVMKALARERDRRYGSAAAFGLDVQHFLDHEPVSATDPTLAYVWGKFVRKHRLPVAFAAGLAIALAVGAVMVGHESKRAREAVIREAAARQEALETVADSYREAGLREARDHRAGLASLWFERAASAAAHDVERATLNAQRAALHTLLAPLPVSYIAAPGFHEFASYDFDESNRFIRESDWPAQARLFDLETGRIMRLDGMEPVLKAASFLPGTGRVAVSDGGETVAIHDLASGERVGGFVLPGETVTALWASPDGSRVLAGGRNVSVWDAGGGRLIRGPLPHPAPVKFARFDPKGRWVLTIDDASDLRVFALGGDSAEPLFPPLRHTELARAQEIMPPRFVGDRIAGNFDGRFSLIDTATGDWIGRLDTVAYDLSPDGTLALLANGLFSLPSRAWVFRRVMNEAQFLPDGSGIYLNETGEFLDLTGARIGNIPFPRWSSAFSSDGSLLVHRAGEGLAVHRLARREILTRIPTAITGRAVFSADSRYFASAGLNDFAQTATTTQVFDLETGEVAGPVLDGGVPLMAATFVAGTPHLMTAHSSRPDLLARGQADDFSSEGSLRLWDWASGTLVAGPVPLPSEPRALLGHPDGSWIAVLCVGGQILRVEPDLGTVAILHEREPQSVAMGHDKINGHLLFSPDGNTLYASGADHGTVAVAVDAGGLRFPPIIQASGTFRLQLWEEILFLPIYYETTDWFRDAATGAPLEQVDPEIKAYQPHGGWLARDGKTMLISGTKQAALLDWRTGEVLGSPFQPPVINSPIASAFVPGTPWIASACREEGKADYRLHLWDARDGREVLPSLALGGHRPGDIATSPDGRKLVVSPRTGGYSILDVARLTAMADRFGELSSDERMRIVETISGYRFVNNTPIRITSLNEWLPLWEEVSRRHPELFSRQLPSEEMRRWHLRRATILVGDVFAAAWHRERAGRYGQR